MVIRDILNRGIKYLENSEYTNPFFEVRLILSKILGYDISYLISHEDENIDKEIENKYFDILRRRNNGEPLQYIFGIVEFYGRDFFIDDNVLIPRNDTEVSIEVLKKLFENYKIENFLEIGCGSGIVSISMAIENKDIKFTSCDISDYAINNTKKNISKYNLDNISVVKSNIYSNIKDKYDIIYSNPPYIKTEEIDYLQREVKDYEPHLALDGGIDGLCFYRKIVSKLDKFLKKDGFVVFEIGHNQSSELRNILSEYNFFVIKDMSGRDRVVIASKGEIDVRKFASI
ncbi:MULTISPECIES: peptide chain release factor N(5)-glutamine methyltransferase [Peptoniphilus]|uniref:peptide chain release factor N(5)-glutamine methyltransferase n=1 Tax=Peptoniphilus TaxID=162289 RepID=UPI0002DE6293|nr:MULTISPECIES: peptide chain release factor N(5)-glutamine methyltransferase [Peptoniphilus]